MSKRRTIKQRMLSYLVVLVALYIIYCGLLFFFQTKLIFPTSMAGQPGQGLPTTDTEVIRLPTDEGQTAAWLVPLTPIEFRQGQQGDADTPRPLAVFFHGNAELIDHQSAIIDLYHGLGMHVLLVEYRGYGHSDGTPSEAHIVADSVAVIRDVIQREAVDADSLVLHGRSIGGGLATQVALQTKPKALIVESTFTSVSGMAMRYGVPPFIVTSPLKSEQAFGELDLPILIMHGKDDSIVPASHGHKLAAAAKNATLVLFNAGHNDLPNGLEIATYRSEVHDHLVRAGVIE